MEIGPENGILDWPVELYFTQFTGNQGTALAGIILLKKRPDDLALEFPQRVCAWTPDVVDE